MDDFVYLIVSAMGMIALLAGLLVIRRCIEERLYGLTLVGVVFSLAGGAVLWKSVPLYLFG